MLRAPRASSGILPLSSQAARRTSRSYWERVAQLGMQVARGLDYAHRQGVLHRDIKPGNLLLDAQGVVWIADFGLAKFKESGDLTCPGDVVGTLRYMAPERFRGREDERSDIYSLGLSLYEAFTLQAAFTEEDRSRLVQLILQGRLERPRQWQPLLPRDLETILLKATATEPAIRYATAGELADDLQRYLEDRPIRARRARWPEQLWRWGRRNPAVAVASVSLTLLLVCLTVFAWGGFYLRSRALAAISRQYRAKVEALAAKDQALREKQEALQAADRSRQVAEHEYARAERHVQLAMAAFDELRTRIAPSQLLQSLDLQLTEEDPAAVAAEVPVLSMPLVTERDAALLETLLKFYDQFAAHNSEDVALQRQAAAAHRHAAEIQGLLGKFEEAERSCGKALEIYRQLSAGQTPLAEDTVAVAALQNELGVLRTRRGRSDGFRYHQAARRHLLSLPDSLRELPACRYELAHTLSLLSPLSHASQLDSQLLRLRRIGLRDVQRQHAAARDILESLVAEFPDDPQYRLALARSYREAAWMLGRIAAANRGAGPASERVGRPLDRAVEILEQLQRQHPQVPQYNYELAVTYMIPGPPTGGEPAAQRLGRAAEILTQLSQLYPQVPEYTISLADCRMVQARLAIEGQRPDDARRWYREASRLQTNVLVHFTLSPQQRFSLSQRALQLARACFDQGYHTESRALLEAAVAEATAWIGERESDAVEDSQPPQPEELRRLLGQRLLGHYRLLAQVYRAQGEVELAERAMGWWQRLQRLVGGRPPGV